MRVNDEWAVTANGIVKRFGDRRVVDGVDIMVPRGSVYGVLVTADVDAALDALGRAAAR